MLADVNMCLLVDVEEVAMLCDGHVMQACTGIDNDLNIRSATTVQQCHRICGCCKSCQAVYCPRFGSLPIS